MTAKERDYLQELKNDLDSRFQHLEDKIDQALKNQDIVNRALFGERNGGGRLIDPTNPGLLERQGEDEGIKNKVKAMYWMGGGLVGLLGIEKIIAYIVPLFTP